jgi:hypothetical protein
MTELRRSKRPKTQTNTARYGKGDKIKYTSNVAHGAANTADDDASTTNGTATGGSSVLHKVIHRRRKGLLARLTEFPLDVLLEVRVSRSSDHESLLDGWGRFSNTCI